MGEENVLARCLESIVYLPVTVVDLGVKEFSLQLEEGIR
jgi:hypothetical protein